MGLEEYREIIHRCFRCGYCKLTSDYNWRGFNCPEYNRFKVESYSPGGMLWLSYAAFVTGELKPDQHLSEIIYSCSMCGNCSAQCRFKFGTMVTEMLRRTREEIVENHPELIPSIVKRFFQNVFKYGNPYGSVEENENLKSEIPLFNEQEYLLFISPLSFFDPLVTESALSLIRLFKKLNISFGTPGYEEICDGNEILMLGEKYLFKEIKKRNIEFMHSKGVKKIVTYSPHTYNAMKNYYKLEGIEVLHYTQLLAEKVKKIRIKERFDKKITYHDPCFLGRYNGIYEEPRKILRYVAEENFVEMPRNRENSFCCGGGGGNFYTDFVGGGKDSPPRVRIREALSTGAEVVAVACPICKMMLTSGVKDEAADLNVLDISEILLPLL